MKKGSFRKVNFTLEHSHMYGHYWLKANYRGKQIKVLVADSFVYDWIDDDSDKEKYNEARKICYDKIRECYEN